MIRVIALLLLSVSLKAQMVYKTPSGAKYHLGNCRMVKNTSQQINISKAVELGLQPCKICKPPGVPALSSPLNKANGEAETVQCKGLQKLVPDAGTQPVLQMDIVFSISQNNRKLYCPRVIQRYTYAVISGAQV